MRPFLLAFLALLAAAPAAAQPLAIISPNPESDGSFGEDVAAVPDAHGDGREDFLIGASQEDGGMSPYGAGRAYLFSGATGAPLHALVSPSPESGANFALDVAGVPDIDGDGRGDLLIPAIREDGGGVNFAGRAYVFSGATGRRLLTAQSPNAERDGYFGSAIAGLRDADGDGRDDGVVATVFEDGGGLRNAGRAYLYRSGGAGGAWVEAEEAAAADPSPEAPAALALSAAPNPFTSATTLRLALLRLADVTVEVLDVLGRRVALLHDGPLAAGPHALALDGAALAPGLYVARAVVGGAEVAVRLAQR